ncbi:MAG: cupin domain-containing protein [Polyangiales bacterium]
MPKIDITTAPVRVGNDYPAPFDAHGLTKGRQKLGDLAGLTQFGVNLLRLPPGEWSAERHWHTAEDEFVWVISGEVTLVTDEGEQRLGPGDCAGFAAGSPNGHHLQNRSNVDAVLLEVGTRSTVDACHYPDIDLHGAAHAYGWQHRDGTPYPPNE